jgi:hypothetical protein
MIEIRFDKTKDEVALLIWFLVDHSVVASITLNYQLIRNSLEFENLFFLFKN